MSIPLIFLLAFAGFIAVAVVRARNGNAKLRALENGAILGDETAIKELVRITHGQANGAAGSACLTLAQHEERRASFRDAFRFTEEGLAKVDTTPGMRAAYADILVPGLHAERGVALAAMGRTELAQEAIRVLGGFPGYAYLTTKIFRIELISATRQGQFERAREIGQKRSADMPLSYREELLCAMLEVQGGGGDDLEKARIVHILRKNDAVRSWVRVVAPGLSEAIGFIGDGVRVDTEPSSEQQADAPESHDETAPAEDDARRRAIQN